MKPGWGQPRLLSGQSTRWAETTRTWPAPTPPFAAASDLTWLSSGSGTAAPAAPVEPAGPVVPEPGAPVTGCAAWLGGEVGARPHPIRRIARIATPRKATR